MYVYIYMSATLSAPEATRGGKHMFKMAFYQLHGCRLCTSGARKIRDQDNAYV